MINVKFLRRGTYTVAHIQRTDIEPVPEILDKRQATFNPRLIGIDEGTVRPKRRGFILMVIEDYSVAHSKPKNLLD